MLKVFLVEDESIVREGLRDNIPWQQYGYQFAGEANDGEMALPLIRKIQPDVLITDIKMPFMDGLALSRIVGQEFPNMKVIIISGYDEFEYARQAIQVGVEQYLLKPITKATLQKVLAEVKEKIEGEQKQKNYLEKFQGEMREFEQFSRRNFFVKVFEGQLSVQEIYEEAQKLSLEIVAPCYNIVLVNLQEMKQEELQYYLLRYPEYLLIRWDANTYGILIKGEEDMIQELTDRCMENIKRICTSTNEETEWYAVAGQPVERLSLLPECYRKVNHVLSFRYFAPHQHILTEHTVADFLPSNDDGKLSELDIAKVNPEILNDFLTKGQREEIEDFVKSYLQNLAEALESKFFRSYLMLSIRFAAIAYAETLGCRQEEFMMSVNTDQLTELASGMKDMQSYMQNLLERAIEIRDREYKNQSKKMIKDALEYIDTNYANEALSLNDVAKITNMSPNYFSSIFSQEMQVTFIEYVTQKRMEKAKKLLRQTEKHTGEIANEVGYKDPHYFSFVFKKTQGCTPREYRTGGKNV